MTVKTVQLFKSDVKSAPLSLYVRGYSFCRNLAYNLQQTKLSDAYFCH